MGATFKTSVCWGACFARDEADRVVGYTGYGIARGARKGDGVRIFTGPVRATYQAAAADARAEADRRA
jgi:hypothetical protein